MKKIFNRTKIVVTLGPSSSTKATLIKMIKAGVDVCRINMSHGAYENHQRVIDIIREINEEYHTNIGILMDLQGPKIRIGEVENNAVQLKKGEELIITTVKQIGNAKKIYITYDNFPRDVRKNEIILLDDGKLQLKVLDTDKKNEVKTKVIFGGILSSNKGVNLPFTKISTPSLTPKDLQDLDFALKNNAEWIGLSFVRKAEDIIELKKIIKNRKSDSRVIAKIEKPEALENIDAIIKETDAIMVARGDLGVELPMEEVPVIQKLIVNKCIQATKPVIIATQMMESMIVNPRPTRAEANDVANSVLDGADAVMLSAETSVGSFPVEVVESMSRIISHVENHNYRYGVDYEPEIGSESFLSDNICYTACMLAEQTGAKGIVAMTHSGYTAFKISSHRSHAPTFIFTGNKSLLNALSLVWGTRGFYYNKFESTDTTISDVNDILKKEKLVKKGDILINTASIPIKRKSRTNMIKLSIVQ